MAISDVIFQTMNEFEKIPIIKEIVPIGTVIGFYFLCKEAAAQLNLLASIIEIVSNIHFLSNNWLGGAIILGIIGYIFKEKL